MVSDNQGAGGWKVWLNVKNTSDSVSSGFPQNKIFCLF